MNPDEDARSDDAAAIADELYRYAELIDSGRFTELGDLMEHCSFVYGDESVPGPSGAEAIAHSYRSMVITYADGTPRTRHVTTNPIIAVHGDTAEVRSVYTVLQQVDGTGIQTIVSGRYRDTLRRIGGSWRFTQRCFLVDLVGDLSRHLRIRLPPGPEHTTDPTDKEQQP